VRVASNPPDHPEARLNAARITAALTAALATACLFAGSAWATDSCKFGLARAGVLDTNRVRAIQATLGPLIAPEVEKGYATAWVGVGRKKWIRVGLRSASSTSPSRVFYEVKRGTHSHWMRFGDRWLSPGESIKVSVRRLPHQRGLWQVFADGKQISAPIYLSRARRLRPAAAADAFNGGSSACNRFKFDFSSVRTKRWSNSGWRPFKGGRVVQDPGYELIRISSAAFVARSSESAGTVFVGDWETGDRSQWDRLHYKTGGVESEQFAIVSDPVRQGAFAARFTVRPGDVFNSGGERSEAVWYSHEKEGDGYWYQWSTLFPTNWTAPSYFGVFLQWHSAFPYSPPIAFDARGDNAQIDMNTGVLDSNGKGTLKQVFPLLSTLSKGAWNDFVVHVRWSLTNGFVTVWHRSGDQPYSRILDLEEVPTLQAQDGNTSENYVKQGLYRWTDPVKTDTLYQDDFRRASSLDGLDLAAADALAIAGS
jgi:hypothetical protein